jgi:predicted DNA-binding protein
MAKLIDKLKKEIKKSKPKTKSISLRLREDYIEALEIVSKATGKTKSEIVEEALRDAGLFDEKAIEYFKSVIEEKERGNETPSNANQQSTSPTT